MSDGGRDRTPLAVGVWKSSQEWRAQRSAVRSIAWLDVLVWWRVVILKVEQLISVTKQVV
jgi:hypothetical protein